MSAPINMTTTSSSTLTEQHIYQSEDYPDDMAPPSSALKRRGSWKRFKETVKGTVQGWVGGSTPPGPTSPDVPSAVFPTSEVTSATINVKQVLHDTNCYSSPKKSGDAAQLQQQLQPPSPTSAELPKIVVTCDAAKDKSPVRPVRRRSSASIAIRPCLSNPNMPLIDPEADLPAFTTPAGRSPPDKDEDDEDDDDDEEAAEIKKRLAVMKIKQAIFSMDLGSAASSSAPATARASGNGGAKTKENAAVASLKSAPMSVDRRMSDSATAVTFAAANVNPQPVKVKTPLSESLSDPPARVNPGGATGRRMPLQRGGVAGGSIPQGPGGPSVPSPQQLAQRRRSTADGSGPGKPVGLGRSQSMKKKKPMIWDHFDTLPNTSQQGRCKTCMMNVSCKFNTGNFVRHLQLAHKDVYRQYQNKMEAQWTRSMIERNLK